MCSVQQPSSQPSGILLRKPQRSFKHERLVLAKRMSGIERIGSELCDVDDRAIGIRELQIEGTGANRPPGTKLLFFCDDDRDFGRYFPVQAHGDFVLAELLDGLVQLDFAAIDGEVLGG